MRILVSGAGIAGLAAALELGERGSEVTVVEYEDQLRLAGTPIDIRGDANEVVERMGLLAKIRERRLRMTESTWFVDGDGEPVARVPVDQINDSDDDIEILRADLVRVLADALPDTAAIRFGDSIEALDDDGDGVGVRFASGRTGRYDLVLGADGQHSAVRGLAFGPEEDFLRHLGVYIAIVPLPGEERSEGVNAMHNVPGRMAAVFRYKDTAVAVFQFRSEPLEYDRRDLDAQKRIIVDAFTGHRSWRIPELLDAVRTAPDLFFDSASQIHAPSWHRGRVVLVGDAGYSPAFLSGRGTSLALTGARILAEELDQCAGDHAAAFERYEARQRPYVAHAQDGAGGGRDFVLPASWEAIEARNEALQAGSTDVL
ncbi:FAD-dependent monooxygenase [Streptomonospora halophila]|uniref:FAD-dependent monooxygenase n=1 Tax=Streptomonospora halophila TaxID=427369 RepID=A0ABP9GEQ3_9ACTN